MVIEIGGGGTFNQSMEALTIGGHISIIGALSGVATELNLLSMVFKNVNTHGTVSYTHLTLPTILLV